MINRRTAVVSAATTTVGLVLGTLLAVIVLAATRFVLTGGLGGPSVTVRDDTDNAVPTVHLRASALPVAA